MSNVRVSGLQVLDWIQAVLATNVVILVLNVFTGVASARALGPAGKGLYNTVMLWTGVAVSLAAAGLPAAFVVLYGTQSRESRSRLLTAAVLLGTLWAVVVAGGMMLVVPHVIAHLGPRVTLWTELALVTVPFGALAGMMQVFITAEHAFRWYNVLRVCQALALAVPMSALWLVGGLTPLRLVILAVANGIAAGFIIVVAAAWLMRRRGLRIRRPGRTSIVNLGSLGMRFYAIGLASLFNARLDQMLTTAWLDARDMGLYTVAGSSLSVLGMASAAFQSVFLPAVVGDDRDSIVNRTETSFRRAWWVLLALTAATVGLAQPVLAFAYGPAYLGSLPAILLLTPAALSVGLIGVLYQGCYALRDATTPLVGEVVGAVSGALMLWMLVPAYGVTGAAVATSASYVLDLVTVSWFWSRRHTGESSLIPGRADLRSVVATVNERSVRYIRQLLPAGRM